MIVNKGAKKLVNIGGHFWVYCRLLIVAFIGHSNFSSPRDYEETEDNSTLQLYLDISLTKV